jgi:hypothetical protein
LFLNKNIFNINKLKRFKNIKKLILNFKQDAIPNILLNIIKKKLLLLNLSRLIKLTLKIYNSNHLLDGSGYEFGTKRFATPVVSNLNYVVANIMITGGIHGR